MCSYVEWRSLEVSNKKICICMFYSDGLGFSTAEIGTVMLIASIFVIIVQFTLISRVSFFRCFCILEMWIIIEICMN